MKRRKLSNIVFCSVLVAGCGVWFGVWYRHNSVCQPFRAAMAKANAAAVADAKAPEPLGSGLAAIDKLGTDEDSLYGVIMAHQSCFSQEDVNAAFDWFHHTSTPDSTVSAYFYCWNSGPPSPHHFGHVVAGDHLCTYGELRASKTFK